MRLVGYSDRLSVAPGESIQFMVSSEHAAFDAEIVHLIHGDPNPDGPGFKERVIESSVSGTYPGKVQPIRTGSYGIVDATPWLDCVGGFTLSAWIFATTPLKGTQALISRWDEGLRLGFALILDEVGALALRVGDGVGEGTVSTGAPLYGHQWYRVGAALDQTSGQVTLTQEPLHRWPMDVSRATVEKSSGCMFAPAADAPLLIGALGTGDGHPTAFFNGKIDGLLILDHAMKQKELRKFDPESATTAGIVARWDLSIGIDSSRLVDTGPNGLHGRVVGSPTRAVTGHNWSGDESNHRQAPGEYGAIHFHDDDLDDANWEQSFAWTLPAEAPSGVYAARISAGGDIDHLPFIVRPSRGTATAKVAYLFSTFTYLAYSDEHVPVEPVELFPFVDMSLHIEEYGYIARNQLNSLYDVHSDGSGVCYASWKRPMVNMRPSAYFRIYGSPERLGTDLYLVDWMETKGIAFDAIADEQIHEEGAELLSRYNVLVTGCHPEYWTAPMMAALDAYIAQGGRVMYLGGNGFYWVTGVNPERPHLIEIRRWRGTETWEAKPGEYHLSTTGELGGLWRNRNREPQKLLGVGFTSQGNDYSRPYRLLPDCRNSRAAFIMEGIEDESIGDFPSLMLRHGAAGYEIDRADLILGTPRHALVLATAGGFSDSYQHAIEEVLSTDGQQGGSIDSEVRADIVYFEGPNGGAVFSVGSIAWLGALSYNGNNNNVSRMTENVLRRFMADEPIVARSAT